MKPLFLIHQLKKPIGFNPWGCIFSLFLTLFWFGCATSNPQSQTTQEEVAPPKILLDEPDRIIRAGDLMRITLKLPGRTYGILEKVTGYGEVPTPNGDMIKAAGLSLQQFRLDLAAYYAAIPGNEEAKVEAYISSSPYAVVKYPQNSVSTSNPSASTPPTVYRRNFQSPLTLWKAIESEGGIPSKVNFKQIRILKMDLTRKVFDCSGKDGSPDGSTPIESGDYIFLVPDDVPATQIFD